MKGFSFINGSITSIDLGSYETKAIEGKQGRDNVTVKKAFSFITPPNSYDNGYFRDEFKMLDSAKDEFRKNNITSKNCHITIKSTAIIIRELQFPPLSSKEIEGLLNYQLEEHLPMDFSKYVIQHKVIEKPVVDGKEKMNILLVAIPKDMVDMHYNFIRELGLKPKVMDYQSNGVWKFLNYSGSINGTIYPKEKTIAAIDLGYCSSNVTIIKKGNGKFNRVIDSGSQSLDNNIMNLFGISSDKLLTYKQEITDVSVIDEGYSDQNRYTNIVKSSIESLMDKIDKVFKYCASNETEDRIETLLLYGGMSKIKGIDKLFTNYFNLPAVVLNNTSKISLEGDINKFAGCIGALIRDDGV